MSPVSLKPCLPEKKKRKVVSFWIKAFKDTAKTQIAFLTAIHWQKWTQKNFEENENCKRYEFGEREYQEKNEIKENKYLRCG